MSIAITGDHRALADTASDFLRKRDARGAARALLEAPDEAPPAFWSDLADLGWLGLHVDESHGGSGSGMEELVVVVEELGRAVAPGPFVPTVVASAVLQAVADDELAPELLPGLADGSRTGGDRARRATSKCATAPPTVGAARARRWARRPAAARERRRRR